MPCVFPEILPIKFIRLVNLELSFESKSWHCVYWQLRFLMCEWSKSWLLEWNVHNENVSIRISWHFYFVKQTKSNPTKYWLKSLNYGAKNWNLVPNSCKSVVSLGDFKDMILSHARCWFSLLICSQPWNISRLRSSAWDIKTKERHWWRHNGDSDRRPLSLPLRYDQVTLCLYGDLGQINGIAGILKLRKRFRMWQI